VERVCKRLAAQSADSCSPNKGHCGPVDCNGEESSCKCKVSAGCHAAATQSGMERNASHLIVPGRPPPPDAAADGFEIVGVEATTEELAGAEGR
jgi:hypothetical protein